jgi:hypothetical protein
VASRQCSPSCAHGSPLRAEPFGWPRRLALAIRGVTSGWSSGTAPRSVLVPIAGSVPNGHDGDRTGDVFGEVFQVAGVTCVYVIAATSGGLDDDGINDVGGSGAAA